MKSIPMISGDEVAALSSERKQLTFRAGDRKAAKRKVSRRARAQARQELRRDAQ